MTKANQYEKILSFLKEEIETGKSVHLLTLYSETVNLIKDAFEDFSWVGFYLSDDVYSLLYLGPYRGKEACEIIPFSKGVCGKCHESKETQLVEDVEKIPYHIACSSTTRSELVIPVLQNGVVISVLDIDSDNLSQFDLVDASYLNQIAELFSSLH